MSISGIITYSKVYGVDNAGYKSRVAISDGLIVDDTPPLPRGSLFDSHNLLFNPSFENTLIQPVNIDSPDGSVVCPSNTPDYWSIPDNECAITITSTKLLAKHGNNSLLLHGTVTQTLNVTEGQMYQVVFYTTHLPLPSSDIATREGYLEWNGNRHVFLTYARDVNINSDYRYLKWHKHIYYFKSEEAEVTLRIGNIGGKGLALDDVQLTMMIADEESDNFGCVASHIVTVDTWSSIHAAWHFEDKETPITSYMWAIGM